MNPIPDKLAVTTGGMDATGGIGSAEKSIDLRALAMLGKHEQVAVQPIDDRTLDAFDQTLAIIRTGGGEGDERSFSETIIRKIEKAPDDSELRKVFIFAEILGGYDAFNDLTRTDSPRYSMSQRYGREVMERELTEMELVQLEEYYDALKQAIENAKEFYRETKLRGLSAAEMNELYGLVLNARGKTKEITEIIGKHLIRQIEKAVARLNEIRLKALQVEPTVSGVFLVDDEVMFIPVNELTDAITTIFKGVGNPYLAGNIDGVLLLAARNLLIEVVSFYSYYGKHQIYQLFKHQQTADRQRIIVRIRNEIRKILRACKEDNKLVLTRIMAKEEEQLDLSIEAIQKEAEKGAVDAVIRIMPPVEPTPPPPPKKSWLKRLFGWMGA